MYIDTQKALAAATTVVNDYLPYTVHTYPVDVHKGVPDGIKFIYKGLTYKFFDFVELIEFLHSTH